jgi:hypothetical protein
VLLGLKLFVYTWAIWLAWAVRSVGQLFTELIIVIQIKIHKILIVLITINGIRFSGWECLNKYNCDM